MEYDVKIGGYNLLQDLGWHVVDKSIGAPELKTHTVEIPGRDGVVDFTSYLRGYAVYGNREITIDIECMAGAEGYASKQSQLLQLFHGRKLEIIFSDDSGYIYRGRVAVKPVTLEDKKLKCTLDIDAEPYKVSVANVASRTINVTKDSMNSSSVTLYTLSGLTLNKIYIPCVKRVSAVGETWYTVRLDIGAQEGGSQRIRFDTKIENDTEFKYEGRVIIPKKLNSVTFTLELIDYESNNMGQTFGSSQTIVALKEAVL